MAIKLRLIRPIIPNFILLLESKLPLLSRRKRSPYHKAKCSHCCAGWYVCYSREQSFSYIQGFKDNTKYCEVLVYGYPAQWNWGNNWYRCSEDSHRALRGVGIYGASLKNNNVPYYQNW